MTDRSLMVQEALGAPNIVAQQLIRHEAGLSALANDLRTNPPAHVFTVARGSSDHACTYLAFLIMSRLGIAVTSLPPSLITHYKSVMSVHNAFAFAISQSGRSPDVVEPMAYFRQAGARTAAFVNDIHSPLASACEWRIALEAGAEVSVAATKSFIASLVVSAHLVARWQQDSKFLQAVLQLPKQLQQACQQDWNALVPQLQQVNRLMVVGRGTGFAVAQEMALKFKETCAIQAEAFSGAEIQHGPMALVNEGYPLLILAPAGPAQAGLLALATQMRARGARVLLAAPQDTPERSVTLVDAHHADLNPILAIQSFYLMTAQLAKARGMNPDQPRHLRKVTETT